MPKKILKKHKRNTAFRPPLARRSSAKRNEGGPSLSGIIRISATFILINIAYLIVLPLITSKLVPCLAKHPFTSYTDAECTVGGALDMFMRLAITGMVVLTLSFLLTMRRYLKLPQFHTIKQWSKIPSAHVFFMEFIPLIITAALMAASIVVFYLIFIHTAELAVRNAPIILSTVPKPL